MSYQDHLKTCSYCSKNNPQKVKISVKAASSYNKQKKLSQLGAIIKGTSYASLEHNFQPKDASSFAGKNIAKPNYLERQFKLKELAKMISDY